MSPEAQRASVLFDVRRATWYPEVGISRYARGLLTAMLELAPADLRVTPIDLSDSGNWRAAPTIRVGRRHGAVSRLVQEQVRIALSSRRAGLLHLPWFEGPVRPGCPLVISVQDLDTMLYPERYPRRFRAYYNTLLRGYIRMARRIIVPSRATLAALDARWPGRPYVQIYHGIDAIFSPSGSEAGHDGPPFDAGHDGPPFILYTGGWGKRKRVRELLQAFSLIAAEHRDVKLVLTGAPGPDERALIAAAGSDRITVTGRVSDQRLATLYRDAAVVAYPSALEGFGFPVVEAFASGTPVVALRAGSVPEVAGDAALLIDSDDAADLAAALTSIIDSPALHRQLRERGLNRAREFTWARAAEQTLAVYREALAESA
jgi:glycosyltransferase involved in cell wall biosynthesis